MQGYTNASASASIRLTDISVTFASQSTPTYSNFPYRASVSVTGCTSNKQATVTYNSTEALSGNYAPWCDTYDGGVYLYSKVASTITVATIVIDQVSNFFNLESTPTQNSGNPISSGGVYTNCVLRNDALTITSVSRYPGSAYASDTSHYVTPQAIANWNGAYTSTTSNLAYCNQGAFGNVVTHADSEFVHLAGTETITGLKTFTDTVYVQFSGSRDYGEGVRINRGTNNWTTVMIGCTRDSGNGMAGGWSIHRDPSGRFVLGARDSNYYSALFYGTYDSSTGLHTLDVPHNFRVGGQQVVQLYNGAYNVSGISGWGTLTGANGYTHSFAVYHYVGGDAGAWAVATKNGAMSMQVDGYYYQREGAYRCLDTSDITVSSSAPSGGKSGDIWIQY